MSSERNKYVYCPSCGTKLDVVIDCIYNMVNVSCKTCGIGYKRSSSMIAGSKVNESKAVDVAIINYCEYALMERGITR